MFLRNYGSHVQGNVAPQPSRPQSAHMLTIQKRSNDECQILLDQWNAMIT
jgi:hypothetical protein